MSFMWKKTSWSNAELALIKADLFCIYALVGAFFHEFFMEYVWVWLAIFAILTVWTFTLWVRKLHEKK